MGNILGNWRGFARGVMITLLGICAYTYLNHPDFASGAEEVKNALKQIQNPALQNQMRVPVALAFLLPIGVKGALASIMLFALLACDGSYMHSWGSIFVQDVILPFRKKPFTPEQHLRVLRWGIAGVAIFAFFFSLLYRQNQYILMFFALTGAVFSGAGAPIIGGLYWKKGTAAAAWGSMITGSTLAVAGLAIKQVNPQFFLNGQVMYFIAMLSSLIVYIVVSLLTCREDFNMERMLHRGKYAVDATGAAPAKRKFTWGSLIGFDKNFTFGDKILSGSLFCWSMFWFAVFVIVTVWNLFSRWPVKWWSTYWHIDAVLIPLGLGVVTTVWFTWGGIRDMIRMARALRTVTRDHRDDGTVLHHHNLNEPDEKPT
jgi:solute:Na+ symporter, SSS family